MAEDHEQEDVLEADEHTALDDLLRSGKFFVIQAITEFFYSETQTRLIDRVGHVCQELSGYAAEVATDRAYKTMAVTATVGKAKFVINATSFRVYASPISSELATVLDNLDEALQVACKGLQAAGISCKANTFKKNGTRISYFRNPKDSAVLNLDRRKFINPDWLSSFADRGDKLYKFVLHLGPDTETEGDRVDTYVEISRGNFKHSQPDPAWDKEFSIGTRLLMSNLTGAVVDIRRGYPKPAKLSVRELAETESFASKSVLSLFEGEGWV